MMLPAVSFSTSVHLLRLCASQKVRVSVCVTTVAHMLQPEHVNLQQASLYGNMEG